MEVVKYRVSLPAGLDSDLLHAQVAALAIPGYLGVNGDAAPLSGDALFTALISAEDKDRLDAACAAHTPRTESKRVQDGSRALLDLGPAAVERLIRTIALLTMDEINLLRAERVGVAQAVWDPASIANGSGLTSPAVTVAGAAFGDCVRVAAPYDLQGLTCTGYVSAANTVRVRLENQTGGAVNLVSGTWGVCVDRPGAVPQRTVPQLIAAARSRNATADAGPPGMA